MRHNAYQTMVPVSHEENIYLPTGFSVSKSVKSYFSSGKEDPKPDTAAKPDKPDEKESMLPSVLKVVFVLALVFGVGLGVPISIAESGERCCRGQKRKTANFEAINTPNKHCCGCRIEMKQAGSSGEEEYNQKVSDEGGSCDPSTDKKVEDLNNPTKLVSRNKVCNNDSKIWPAWLVAIVWWGGVIYFTYVK